MLELHAAHQELAGAWDLPETTEERRDVPRSWVRWEDLGEPSTRAGRANDPRTALYGGQREELQQEAEWAASVR